jgi:predicted site-specific integrase-resolvase
MVSDSSTTSGHTWPVTSANDEPFLTEPEAADVIRVSARTLRRWRQQGTGPPVAGYAGRRALYRRSELLAWLRRKREGG